MTQPTAPRPVPGPPRAAPGPAAEPTTGRDVPAGQPEAPSPEHGLAGLDALPVSEHVALFEAEHARLQRELGTIDPR